MRKNQIFALLMCLAVMATAWAESINERQASRIAADFMASHSMPSTRLTKAIQAPRIGAQAGSKNVAYYVFNADRGGYVIVAGDDRAPAVLGYSDKGNFDAQNVPEAMQELLDGYAYQIEALANGAKSVSIKSPGNAVRPMVTAAWTQNEPYNSMLPMLSNGSQAVAGCVATAMAQLLYYWKYPAQVTTTLPSYTSQSLQIYMPALEPVDFNWEAMQDTYLDNDTQSEGAQAAAQLTLYCAQSVEMNFMYGTSGANTNRVPRVLSTYFGFKSSAHCEYRENFTTQGWADLIYNELAAQRPVVYSGSKASGGHAFICDGYDGAGMFHINWGWNGLSNGYFLLNVLNPDAQGTGAANEAYGYIYNQYIVCGIEPGVDDGEFALTAGDVALNDAVTSRISNNANFQVTVTGRFYNYTTQSIAVSYGWGFYDGDELLSVLYSRGASSLPSGYFFRTDNEQLSFGKGITSGTYRIVPIYSELNAGNWRPCKGGDTNFIEVTIDGDNCTVTGYGTAGQRNYVINSITCDGSMHHGRPLDLVLNITNEGYTQSELLYMLVNDTFYSTGFVGMGHGETDDVTFRFLPTAPGDYTCMFSFNQDGSDPVGYTTITVGQMPAANLSIAYEVLNVTDPQNNTITSDKFSLKLTVTNNGTESYYDDITVKLYKNLDGTYGSNAQIQNQLVRIEPNETVELQFDMDNVIDGWDYFAAIYYYSSGQQSSPRVTPHYTMVFPEEPEVKMGDVNGDTFVNVSDVTMTIAYILGNPFTGDFNSQAADIDDNGTINVADVTALIKMILESGN